LNTRLQVPGLQPVRIVIDGQLTISEQSTIVQTAKQQRTIVVASQQVSENDAHRLEKLGVEVLRAGQGHRVDLHEMMRLLGEREIGSILLEGGGRLNGAMLEAKLIDKIILFFAPKIVGGSVGTFQFDGFDQ